MIMQRKNANKMQYVRGQHALKSTGKHFYYIYWSYMMVWTSEEKI